MVKSINYPIAKDIDGNWIHISEAKRSDQVFCPECQSQFLIKLGSVRKHHFAHRPGVLANCSGESGYHSMAKHWLAYHFEQNNQILVKEICQCCKRENEKVININHVEVEKTQNNHRPDVALLLDNGEVISCEIVYRNPLGDKMALLKEKGAYLLIWFISSQIEYIPSIKYLSWDDKEAQEHMLKKDYRDYLIFLAYPDSNHECMPWGEAYIFDQECIRCKQQTKVAKLIDWFPCWAKYGDLSLTPLRAIPTGFINSLNNKYNTHLRNDYSKAAKKHYVMNHCKCGTQIPDYYVNTRFREMAEEQKIIEKIDFKLTDYENNALSEAISSGRPLGNTHDQAKYYDLLDSVQ